MSFHLDYETFSAVDLKKRGAYRYAADKSTEILLLGIAKDRAAPRLWVNPKYDPMRVWTDPEADVLMREMVASDEEVYAHSAPFEAAISRYCWQRDTGLPPIGLHRYRCTAAMARRAGLPADLAGVGRTLGLTQQKDEAGRKLIALLCCPDKKGKRNWPNHHPREFLALGRYCLQDVRTEQAVHQRLEPFELDGALLESFQFDMAINDFGIPINVPALRNAQVIIDEVFADLGVQFNEMTGLNPSQREAVKSWLLDRGLDLPDMQADTIEEALEGKMPAVCRPVVELYSLLQFAAIKKVKAMLDADCGDGWLRGLLIWYGAGTGRWAGRGVQPQNFKRPTFKDTDIAYRMICNGCSREDLDLLWGNSLDVLSSCIRHFIHWQEGSLLDADYSAIEARIVCWLAGQHNAIKRYVLADNWTGDKKLKPDPYRDMAATIYQKLVAGIDKDEREVGKRAVLGCGYQMAGEKFQKTCKVQYGIDISRELADTAVEAYRKTYYKVKELWDLCDKAARLAISKPGSMFTAGDKLRFVVKNIAGIPFLLLKLPSGRCIYYPYPLLESAVKFGRRTTQITYFGEIKNGKWGRIGTYGGKLVENATQGVAADVMSIGGVNATRKGFKIITLIHDQAPALALPGQKIEDYVTALTTLPSWADGLPIKADGRVIPYYKKA